MIFLFSNNGFYVHKRAYSGVSDRTILGEYCTAYLPFQSSSTNLDIRSILKALPAHCRHILYAYTVNVFQPEKKLLSEIRTYQMFNQKSELLISCVMEEETKCVF